MKYYTRAKITEDSLTLDYETLSVNEILDEYFPDWMVMMAQTNRPITEDGCVEDWVLFHHAWETDSGGYHVLPASASGVSEWS